MNVLEAALRRAVNDLSRHGVTWALVGGFAVSARAEPRFTRDVDIAVAVASDTAAETLIHTLLREGYRLLSSIEQEATGRLATVRLRLPVSEEEDVVVDLLFASSGIEPEIAKAADETEIVPGLALPIASRGHLIALKLLARDDDRRPQDHADLQALCSAANPEDFSLAHDALRLISQRGFDRGRDLIAALEAFQAEGPTN